jgi:molecular chaperone DnaJ
MADVLGIPVSAQQGEIRKAYTKQALICHPDVSDKPDAAEKFMIISQA